MKTIMLLLMSVLMSEATVVARWESQSSGTGVRLRGVSAVSGSIAWASGDKGTYLRTTDGGRTWQAGTVPGALELDFRDVAAFDADTAYLLSIGEGEKSRIYKTIDGGARWTLQFKSRRPTAFFDAMAFWDRDHGIAMSDPVDGKFLIITTSDGGATWQEAPSSGMPTALAGEGAFAASGTCIAVRDKRHVWFGTGGPAGARVFRSTDRGRSWQVANTPVVSGKSAGIFSVAFADARHGVVVGGDYTRESEAKNNVAMSRDGGQTWTAINGAAPNGYRSCVAFIPGVSRPLLISAGPSGSDYSFDGGESWKSLSAEGFHSVSFVGRGNAIGWAVGENGRVAKYAGAPPN
ncbi:MAG: WD40/YVTN/BNR-like repeat-containing protein [Pyrinomonadaceae bacterium]